MDGESDSGNSLLPTLHDHNNDMKTALTTKIFQLCNIVKTCTGNKSEASKFRIMKSKFMKKSQAYKRGNNCRRLCLEEKSMPSITC